MRFNDVNYDEVARKMRRAGYELVGVPPRWVKAAHATTPAVQGEQPDSEPKPVSP